MHYQQITIPVADTALQEILIARLGEYGYEGFEQEGSGLHAFIPEAGFDPATLESVLSGWQLSYTRTRLAARNWNEEWEKNFEPVIVEAFCAIRAAFHAPIAGVQHELVITPKMSFGTGHHATTYMMMASMQRLPLENAEVLDFGTGTGVLAILAERLGAASVLAIDNDDWSIENARENVAENHCSRIRVEKMDVIPPDGLFDVILANINRHVILRELPSIGQHLREGGVILLSGLLQEDFEDIEKEAVINNLSISGRITKSNWICLQVLTTSSVLPPRD